MLRAAFERIDDTAKSIKEGYAARRSCVVRRAFWLYNPAEGEREVASLMRSCGPSVRTVGQEHL